MIEVFAAELVEFLCGFHAADGVFEFGGDAVADVDQGFFHPLDVERGVVCGVFAGEFCGKFLDVFEQVTMRGAEGWGAVEGGFDLVEQPGVADRAAAYHEAGGGGFAVVGRGGLGIDDVSVRDHRAGHGFDGEFHLIWPDRGLVAVGDGAAVDGQGVDGVFAEDFQEGVEFVGALEAEAGFHSETTGDRIAKCAEDFIDLIRETQQSTACVFPVNDRCGAAEIKIDTCDRELRELAGGADHFGDVAAYHLREDGAACVVFRKRAEDVSVEARVRMDAEVFGHEPVR